jgi:hypothetical protein
MPNRETPQTNEPASGNIIEQAFLGRVVVEMWDTQDVVAITGPESQIMSRAMQILTEILDGHPST